MEILFTLFLLGKIIVNEAQHPYVPQAPVAQVSPLTVIHGLHPSASVLPYGIPLSPNLVPYAAPALHITPIDNVPGVGLLLPSGSVPYAPVAYLLRPGNVGQFFELDNGPVGVNRADGSISSDSVKGEESTFGNSDSGYDDPESYKKGIVEKITFPHYPRTPLCGLAYAASTATAASRFKSSNDVFNPDSARDTLGAEADTDNADDYLTSLAWEGPDLTQTLFYQVMGYPSIFANKITFGEVASRHESPWQVAMFVGGKFHCGASIISEYHLLTAAHCVSSYKRRPSSLKIKLGEWDLRSNTDGPTVRARIAKVNLHPEFDLFNLKNDIAILKVSRKIRFTEQIRSVCLPPKDLLAEGKIIKVTGWGRNENNLLMTKLQKLNAIVIRNDECSAAWILKGAPSTLIAETVLCMNAQDGDSCKGDSGGPSVLEYPENSGRIVQVGIVSYGSGSCTDAKLPGVYTRVNKYIDWIDTTMAL